MLEEHKVTWKKDTESKSFLDVFREKIEATKNDPNSLFTGKKSILPPKVVKISWGLQIIIRRMENSLNLFFLRGAVTLCNLGPVFGRLGNVQLHTNIRNTVHAALSRSARKSPQGTGLATPRRRYTGLFNESKASADMLCFFPKVSSLSK